MNQQKPSVLISLLPVITLIGLLVVNITIFKDDASYGANQIALLLSAALCVLIGIKKLKVPYKDIEAKVISSIQSAMQAIIILLIVGMLIGLWIQSGIVPAMIFYGLKIIHPAIFLPLSCIVCSIVALATGSSWSTTGTVGVALIAIGNTMGIPLGMVAGAIISGAYFGDKMSPLSDTTNLAPAMAGTDLITHIKYMLYTTVPSIIIAIILFTLLGFFYTTGEHTNSDQIQIVLDTISSKFNISIFLFAAPLLVIIMVAKKTPAIMALFIGAMIGALFTIIFQQDLLHATLGDNFSIEGVYTQLVKVSYGGFSIESGNAFIDKLLSRGGMSGMLNTIWLIICAMIFGGAMEATNMLGRLAEWILNKVTTAAGLIGSTIASCILLNLTASDQYLAIVVPGRMFKKAYEDFDLAPENLSRALEDAGTVTSVLVPWNSGGAYNSSVLGVATLSYLPFCFFNLISPLMSVFIATVGYNIRKRTAEIVNSAS